MKTQFETQHQNSSTSTGFIFWKVSNLHQRLQREALKHLDLTPSQFSLLACYFYISDKIQKPLSQSDVVAHSGLDKMVVSDLTKALESKNFLLRHKSKTDKRSYEIELTPQGKKVCNQAVKIIEKIDTELFSTSNNKDEFHSMLIQILEAHKN